MATLDTKIELTEERATAMTRLRLSVGTCAVLIATLIARTIITVSAQDIRCGISHIGLTEASHETLCSRVVSSKFLLEHPRGNAFVVASHVSVVAEQRSRMYRIPGQDANVLLV